MDVTCGAKHKLTWILMIMNQTNKDSNSELSWRIVEPILGSITLAYFLIYPRDTLSDFVVCTILCLLLMFGAARVGLVKPTVRQFSKLFSCIYADADISNY